MPQNQIVIIEIAFCQTCEVFSLPIDGSEISQADNDRGYSYTCKSCKDKIKTELIEEPVNES